MFINHQQMPESDLTLYKIALVREEILAEIAADIKLIRDRAGLPELAAPTLAQILNERELELAFEGQGIWDAKRLKLSVDGRSWDDPKLTFPMPLRERNINGGLDQNPGYN